MVDLVAHDGAVFVAGVGHLAEMRNDHVIGEEVAPGEDGRRVRRRRFDDNHRRAASGAFPVVSEVPVEWQAAFGHVGGVGSENDAVFQFMSAQLHRAEDMGKGCLCHEKSLITINCVMAEEAVARGSRRQSPAASRSGHGRHRPLAGHRPRPCRRPGGLRAGTLPA